jgi:tetratricopeptide (TPR) repeat protein
MENMRVSSWMKLSLSKPFLAIIILTAVSSNFGQCSERQSGAILFAIGMASYHTENNLDALVCFVKAHKNAPDWAPPYVGVGLVLRRAKLDSAALICFSHAIALNPKLREARFLCIKTCENLGKSDRVIDDCSILLDTDPNNEGAILYRAAAYADTDHYERALADIKKLLLQDAENWNAYALRGATYKKMNLDAKALEDCSVALTHVNSLTTELALIAYDARANIELSRENYPAVFRDCEAALNRKATDADIYGLRGKAYFLTESYEKAIGDFDKALQYDPKNVSAHVNKGVALLEIDKKDLAIEAFNSAIAINPKSKHGLYNRALAFLKSNLQNKAIADCNAALKLDPGFVHCYVCRGTARLDLKEYEKAISDFSQAIRLDPKGSLAYRRRAQAHTALGNEKEASFDIKMADKVLEK